MTIGIYAIYFSNMDKVYIGQSSNIERRVNTHKRELIKGTHVNHKLQEIYALQQEFYFSIVEECSLEFLTSQECYWIDEFDSINNGYNITYPSGLGSGPYYSNSKYDILTILQVFRHSYLDEYRRLSYKDISEKLNVSIDVVNAVRSQKSHLWLKEKHPYQYDKMLKILGTRNGKLTGETHLLKSPTSEIFEVTNISGFANKNNLDRRHLHKVIQGKALSHKGWVLA